MSAATRFGLAAAALLASLSSVSAATLDIRDCPLDTLVFVDPWADSVFEVTRVGRSERWQCPDGVRPPHHSCRGPYGDTVLQGMFAEYGSTTKVPMTATYSVVPGVPCCDWTVAEGATGGAGANFRWFAAGEAPLLRSQPWLSIDSDDGEDFGNPLFAAACTLP